jgi:hypothetical protein
MPFKKEARTSFCLYIVTGSPPDSCRLQRKHMPYLHAVAARELNCTLQHQRNLFGHVRFIRFLTTC